MADQKNGGLSRFSCDSLLLVQWSLSVLLALTVSFNEDPAGLHLEFKRTARRLCERVYWPALFSAEHVLLQNARGMLRIAWKLQVEHTRESDFQ